MDTFIAFDLEFTSWEGALEQGWSAPGQFREIVQIGALRVRADLSVVDEFEIVVSPHYNPQLSDYFTDLTGITQEQVDDCGVPPAEALDGFLEFCRGQGVLSYGNDMVVLGENIGWAIARGEKLRNSFLDAHFINIRPWVNTVAPSTRLANVGRLWEVLGLRKPATGNEHSALFDCHSMVAALEFLAASGNPLPEGCVAPQRT